MNIVNNNAYCPNIPFESLSGPVQWKYGEFSREKYDNTRKKSSWTKKVTVLFHFPAAILKAVYHLFIRISATFLRWSANDKKVEWFTAKRYLQEAYGWLASLFNDKYSYHIDEAQFQNKCYRIAQDNFYSHCDKHTFKSFKSLDHETQIKFLKHLKLNKHWKAFSKNGIDLFEFMKNQPDPILETIQINEVSKPLSNSALFYMAIKDEDLLDLQVNQLPREKELGADFYNSLSERLEIIYKQNSTEKKHSNILTLRSLMLKTDDEIANSINALPRTAISLLRDDQLQKVKLSSVEPKLIYALFIHKNDDQVAKRVSILGIGEVLKTLINLKDENLAARILSVTKLDEVPLAELTRETSRLIFDHANVDFDKYGPQTLNEALKAGNICPSVVYKEADEEQWNQIDPKIFYEAATDEIHAFAKTNQSVTPHIGELLDILFNNFDPKHHNFINVDFLESLKRIQFRSEGYDKQLNIRNFFIPTDDMGDEAYSLTMKRMGKIIKVLENEDSQKGTFLRECYGRWFFRDLTLSSSQKWLSNKEKIQSVLNQAKADLESSPKVYEKVILKRIIQRYEEKLKQLNNGQKVSFPHYHHFVKTPEPMKDILKDGVIRDMSQSTRAFKGAYVAAQETTGYGNHGFAFTKTKIQKEPFSYISNLSASQQQGHRMVWYGVKEKIRLIDKDKNTPENHKFRALYCVATNPPPEEIVDNDAYNNYLQQKKSDIEKMTEKKLNDFNVVTKEEFFFELRYLYKSEGILVPLHWKLSERN